MLSPSETTSDTEEKLADYRAAGTALLWVIDPAKRLVTVYAADAPTRWYRSGDGLDGAAVVPGFTMAVDDLFEDVAAEDERPALPPASALVAEPPVAGEVPGHVVPHRLA